MWIHPTFPQASFVLSVVSFCLLRADLNELPVLKGFLGDPNPGANSQKASYEGSSPRTGTASRERMGAQAQVTPWAWRKPTAENCNMLNQDGPITSCSTMFDWWLHIYNRYTWFDLILLHYMICATSMIHVLYMMTLCQVGGRRPAPGLGRTWLGNGATAFEAQLCRAVTRWSCDALHRQTWHVFVLSNHVLLSFNVIKILWDYMTMIYNDQLSSFSNLYYVLKSYLYVVPISTCHRRRVDTWFLLSVLLYQSWCIFCKDLPHSKPEEVTVLAVYRLPIPSPAQAWTWKQRWQKTKRTVGPVGPVGPRLGWTPTDPVLSLLFTVPLTVGNEYNM